MMKEKFIKETDQRPKGSESDARQAPDQVEQAGRWAAGELTGRAVEHGREYAKKKFASAHGENQAAPVPASHGNESPSAEVVPKGHADGAPRGQSAPEHPTAASEMADLSPTTPKEHPQAEYTANPMKERQTVERRAAAKEQPQPYRTTQSTRGGQPQPHDGAPLKERPGTQAVKERSPVDMTRSIAGDTAPKTAAPGDNSEAVPPKRRQHQAVKNQAIVDTPRTDGKPAISRDTAPQAAARQSPAAPRRDSETVPFKMRQQKALKERPRLTLREREPAASTAAIPGPAFKEKAPRPTKAALSPKVRQGVVKPLAKPSVQPGVPGTRALKTGQKQMQRRAFTQAAKSAKSIGIAIWRAIQVVVKAVAAVTGAVSAVVGGCVLLVALIIIIVIAAVASSPFGLFFAQEPSAPDTVSVSQAVESINAAYNARLELLQAGDYDSIDIQGAAPDWTDVLAVFAVKLAGADAGGVDIATLNTDRVNKLTDVFWDMTDLTSTVETIPHADSDPDDDVDDSWTEKILHITITSKTADGMRTVYAFTGYQNSALDELLADRAALSSLI